MRLSHHETKSAPDLLIINLDQQQSQAATNGKGGQLASTISGPMTLSPQSSVNLMGASSMDSPGSAGKTLAACLAMPWEGAPEADAGQVQIVNGSGGGVSGSGGSVAGYSNAATTAGGVTAGGISQSASPKNSGEGEGNNEEREEEEEERLRNELDEVRTSPL